MGAAEQYDAIVVGSGQAGTPLSSALAGAGLRTVLIEREHVGGTCVNEGCTPTKTMVASGRVAYLSRRGADYGVQTGKITIDQKRVRERKREIVNSFRNGSQKKLENAKNLDLIFGTGAFSGAKSITFRGNDGSERNFTADKIFINAGTRAGLPAIEGLRTVPFLDNKSIMELDAVPEHLLVLGGGYIGVEFGQMFRRFGSRVTIVQSGPRLLAREDVDITDAMAKVFDQDGMELLFNAKTQRISGGAGLIKMEVAVDGQKKQLEGSHLLVATGRVPNSDTLNLQAAGVATDDHGFIKTNSKLETNVRGIWALGDIKGGPAFTHISYDDFRIIKWNVLEKKNVTTEGRLVPYTVFSDPQLGRVGMTEDEARRSGKKLRVFTMPMSSVARALEMDESRGFMKAVVDEASGQILGAAVLGIEGGETMALFEIAMMGKVPWTALRDGIFAHPTLAESLNNLFAGEGKA